MLGKNRGKRKEDRNVGVRPVDGEAESMNIFVGIMLFFAALGLLDEILGGKLGFMPDFEKGLTTMGGGGSFNGGFLFHRGDVCADPCRADCRCRRENAF